MSASRAFFRQLLVCLGIYVFSFIVRAAYLLIAPHWPVAFGDGVGYLVLAGDLASAYPSLPAPNHSFWEIARITGPGYPIFLAVVAWIAGFPMPHDVSGLLSRDLPMATEWFWPFRWAQCAIGATIPVATYIVGRYTAPRCGTQIGLVAAGLVSLYPPHILYVSYLVTETVGIALLWGGLAVLAYGRHRRRFAGIAIAGFVIGIACLTRATVTYCAVLLPFAIWICHWQPGKKDKVKAVAAFVLPVVSLVAAWGIVTAQHQTNPVLGSGAFQARWIALSNALLPMQYPWAEDRLPVSTDIPDYRTSSPANAQAANKIHEAQISADGNTLVFPVPYRIVSSFAGNRTRITMTVGTNAEPVSFAARYVAYRAAAGAWHDFSATGAQQQFSFDHDIPLATFRNDDRIEIKSVNSRSLAALQIPTVSLELVHPARSPLAVFQRLPQALGLAFINNWFAEDYGNLAAGQEIFPKPFMQIAHHAIVVLAFCGLCWALREAWNWAFVLVVFLAMVMLSASWVEVRHNMPFVPALCLLGGLFICQGLSDARRAMTWRSPLAWMAAALAVAGIVLLLARLLVADASVLAMLDDLAVLPFVLAGGFLFLAGTSMLRERDAKTYPRTATILGGLLPSAIFLIGYIAYLSASDVPRQQYRYVDITAGRRLVQKIVLGGPLQIDRDADAYVLLDLRSPSASPPLKVELDGIFVPGTGRWRHLYPVDLALEREPKDGGTPSREIYEWYNNRYGRPFTSWPQWWALPVPAEDLIGRRALTINISEEARISGAAASQVEAQSRSLQLGAVTGAQKGNLIRGPSLSRTSLGRWRTLDDWRYWEDIKVASEASSSFEIAGDLPPRKLDVTLGVRILIRSPDGQWTVY